MPHQGKSRQLRNILEKLAAWLIVLSFSLILLLILYNNIYSGILILVILILINIGIIITPRRNWPWKEFLSEVKFASICIVSFFTTILFLEILFPQILPREYSSIIDLSQRYRSQFIRPIADFKVVFKNQNRRRLSTEDCVRAQKGERIPWHEPGKIFEYYGYEPNEGFKYINVVCWNRKGYFDNDYNFKKRREVYRIVIVGDSYVEAVQVPLSNTFHKLLESALNDSSGCNRDSTVEFEVIALGNSGAGERKNLKVLKREAAAYNPNMVVLVMSHNDFCDDDPVLNRERTLYMGETSPLIRGLFRHNLILVAFALNRFQELKRNRIGINPELLQWSGNDIPRIEAAWHRSLSLVKDARDYCVDLRIDFKLVYTSSELEVKHALDPKGTIEALRKMGGTHKNIPWDLTRSIQRVSSFCQEKNIDLIILWKRLVDAQKQTGKVVFGDHYTFFGHKIVAQALIDSLNPKIKTRPGRSGAP